MKKILIYAENIERATFFSSLIKEISFIKDTDVIFITDKYAVYKFLIKNKLIAFSIRKKDAKISEERSELYNVLVKNSINYIRGQVNSEQGVNILCSLDYLLSENKIKPDFLFIFNGESFIDKFLINEFENCEKLYFEVGNFPNRMFVDSLGVNAKSSLYQKNIKGNPIYKDFNYNMIMSVKKKSPPQAKLTISDKLFSWVWNIVGIIALDYHYTYFESLFCKAQMFFSSKLSKFYIKKYQNIELINLQYVADYVFIPLQVSSDTQIVFNSDITNEQLIECSIKDNNNIIIKFHPAERNYKEIKKIYCKYSKYKNIFFTSDIDTPTLIEYSKSVRTINSNVGLETILQGKNVEFLGRTIYNGFDFLKSVTYINDFLLPISYPKVKKIDDQTQCKLYKRFFS